MTRNEKIQYLIREHGTKNVMGTITPNIWDIQGALRGFGQ